MIRATIAAYHGLRSIEEDEPMFPASTRSGQCVAAFPDVCKTPNTPAPLTPIPYPNIGTAASASKTAAKVKIPPRGSAYSRTSGDEPGVQKGIVSSKNMGQVTPAQKNMAIQKLKTHLANLHTQLSQLDGRDPNKWHELLDDYVVRSAELYKTLNLD
jgi:hypothetical protein